MPAIFQRAIEGLLQGVLMTAVVLDDVIVTSKTKVEYENNLLEVLTQLTPATLNSCSCREQIIIIAEDKPFHLVKTIFKYSY